MTTNEHTEQREREELIRRIRGAMNDVRRSYTLSDLIPMMQQAVDMLAADKAGGEPVAYGFRDKNGVIMDCITPAEHDREPGKYNVPLYTHHQQAEAVRVPLTDEHIRDCWDSVRHIAGESPKIHALVRSVEAAHGITAPKQQEPGA